MLDSHLRDDSPLAPQLIRGVVGGTLMGLANLVPGISGGTMLLAAGVYPAFIQGVAEATTLRIHRRGLAMLGAIGGAAVVAIVALAGIVKGLVVDHRWVMFSLFIGLTLGGIPVIWGLLRRFTPSAAAGCAVGVAVMAAMAMVTPGASSAASGDRAYLLLFTAGAAGAGAMILPGVSGGYLLLILGQYLPILGAIDDAKTALLGNGAAGPDWVKLAEAMHVFVPVGLGVAIGIVGVSNLVRWLLDRFRTATLGFLLGLLVGAVFGLWPYQQGVRPAEGDVFKGRVMTAELIGGLDPDDYPLEGFTPSGGQIAGAIALIGAGFGITQAVALLGGAKQEAEPGQAG